MLIHLVVPRSGRCTRGNIKSRSFSRVTKTEFRVAQDSHQRANNPSAFPARRVPTFEKARETADAMGVGFRDNAMVHIGRADHAIANQLDRRVEKIWNGKRLVTKIPASVKREIAAEEKDLLAARPEPRIPKTCYHITQA